MNAGRDVERLIADWFVEEAVLRAPDRVLEGAGRVVDRTKQRRLGVAWRIPVMSAPFRLVAAAVLGVLVVGGALILSRPSGPTVGEHSPSQVVPTTAPTPVALTKTLNSGRHGYTIDYPDGWIPTLATGSWLPGTSILWGDPGLDVIRSDDARLVASSQPLTGRQSADAWYQAYCGGSGPVTDTCRAYATTWSPIQIGSKTGYVDLDGVPAAGGTIKPGGPVYDAVVVVDGRGYAFMLDGDVDRGLFEHLLKSVTFTAATSSPLDQLTGTFDSAMYGYSIRVDPSWTTKNATVLIDDPSSTDETAYDTIKVTGTDTTVQGAAWDLAGRTFDRFLADKHQEAVDSDLPQECKGLDPSQWPEVPIGDATGREMTLCNYAEFYVQAGDKVFTFIWGHDTFDTTQHLDMNDFKALLRTVAFTGP